MKSEKDYYEMGFNDGINANNDRYNRMLNLQDLLINSLDGGIWAHTDMPIVKCFNKYFSGFQCGKDSR